MANMRQAVSSFYEKRRFILSILVFTSAYFDLEKQDAVIILMNRDVDAVTENAMDEIRNKLLNYRQEKVNE